MCDLSEPPNQQDALSHGPYRKPKPPENLAVRDLHRHEEQSHTGPREHKVCVWGGEGGACEGGLRGERHRTDVKRSLQCLQEITDGCCMSMAAVKWRQGVTLESGGKSNILLHLTHTNKDPPPCCTCPWLLSIFIAPLYNKFTGKNLAYVLSALPHLSLLNPTPISKLPLSTTCTGANPQVRFRSMYLTTP